MKKYYFPLLSLGTMPFAVVAAPLAYEPPKAEKASAAPVRQQSAPAPAHASPVPTQQKPDELITVTGRATPPPEITDTRYLPTPDASTLRTTTSVLNIPQVVNIVSQQVIRDQEPRNLDDALINVSGITQGNTLAGTQDTIMKRGFGGNRDGSIMHNGMPLVQGRGFNAAANSVEVLKGPSSLLYGIMDPGGVINIVSKKPRLQARTIASVMGSTYGRGKDGFEGMLDSTGPIGKGKLAYRLVLDRIAEDYWRSFGMHQETLIAPSLAWLGKKTQITAWYEFRDFLYPFDRGTALDPRTGSPLAIPATRRLDENFNRMTGQSHLGQISLDHRFGAGWSAHVNFSYNQETYDANQLRVTGVNVTKGTLSRSNDATHGAFSSDTYGTAYLDGPIRIGNFKQTIQIGMDGEYRLIYRKDLLRQSSKYTFSYLKPVYGLENPSSTVSASDSDQTDNLHDYSGFLRDTFKLGERWVVVGGVRYLSYRQIAGRGRPFKANTDIGDGAFLPQAGLVYRAAPAWSLYASYTQSLKPASTIAPLSSGLVLGSGFQPEKGRSYEFGAKMALHDRLTGTLAFYDIHKRNVLVSQYNDATKQTDYRTAGAARSRGIEFDLAGRVTKRLSMIGSYAYLDGATTKDPLYAGKQLWNAARHTASMGLAYDLGPVFGEDKLRFGGDAHYVGRRAGDSANSFFLPGYVTGDLFATYDRVIARHDVNFQFNIKNLSNAVYYPSGVNSYFVSLGEARRFSLRTMVAF
ncbi:TonB-dependent siderophore receptor [Asaia siamensis]|uniref:TonB-dependent receptor n=1 Tax=Asaia siamensis TaxID=110479 RepID=A0ABQ1L7W2_9PROT|nr:TonB-dependent siderophore receptor [Asaia siamensis]GBR09725.1 TonB-dependent receptor [Asaia siamensis NRIC 0323]GGC19276.1 TonB-dependent receptor [Asaia siamensis]